MNNEFIPYNLAGELKELGFDDYCFGFYAFTDKDGKMILHHSKSKYKNNQIEDDGEPVAAPLWQQAFRWFRDKHKLMCFIPDIEVNAGNKIGYRFRFQIWKIDSNFFINDDSLLGYYDYEEAELECLKKLVEIVKNNKDE